MSGKDQESLQSIKPFFTKRDSNKSSQLQRLPRKLKFRKYQV